MRIGRHHLSRLHEPLAGSVVAVCLGKSLFSLSLQAVSLVAESLGHGLPKLLLSSAVAGVVVMVGSHHGLLVSVLLGVVGAGVIIAGQVEGSLPSLGRRSAGVDAGAGGGGMD